MPDFNKKKVQIKTVSSRSLAVGIFAIIFLWILSGIFSDSDNGKNNQINNGKIVPSVVTKNSVAKNIEDELVLYGITQNARKVDVMPRIAGRVSDIIVNDGEEVKSGEVIVKLELDEKQALVNEAKSFLEQRKLEYKVAKTLSKSGHQSETKLMAAQAALRSAERQLMQANLNLSYTDISAPFDGVVQKINVEQGDVVDAKTVITTIIDDSYFVAVCQVPEKRISDVKAGGTAHIMTIGGVKAEGVVRYVSDVSDPATRTYRVEVEIPNFDYKIADGMTTEITIPIGMVAAHLIPSSALSLDESGNIGIKTLDEENNVLFYKVKIIKEAKGGLWVTGPPDNAKIITTGQAFVREGDKAIVAN